MRGDAVGRAGVGGGGEVDGATGGLLLLKVLQKFAVVREVGYVQLNSARDVLLQGRFALGEPSGETEESGGMMPGQGESGVGERVGFDERAVEVDAERRECRFEDRSRSGQQKFLPMDKLGDYRTTERASKMSGTL